jgi:hypothetical protein
VDTSSPFLLFEPSELTLCFPDFICHFAAYLFLSRCCVEG